MLLPGPSNIFRGRKFRWRPAKCVSENLALHFKDVAAPLFGQNDVFFVYY